MKKTLTAIMASLLLIATLLTLAACKSVDPNGLWEGATYLTERTLGRGDKSVTVTVEAGDQSLDFTVRTDKEMLDEALLDVGLVSGEYGSYGLTVISVNGIEAVWERDNAYWAIYIDGEYSMSGISSIPVEDGRTYKLLWSRM